uniref:Carboxylic ester hydrolase n=1 Tax=Timema poppense TaxID=170557 RepID=A0A7R9HAB6_TIMPO|nr:unnamed protein product [Timema poppensis]
MEDTVTVKLSQGVLRGRKVASLSGTGYYSFQGVPYAKPPVGPLRFKKLLICPHEAELISFQTYWFTEKILDVAGIKPRTSGSVTRNSDHQAVVSMITHYVADYLCTSITDSALSYEFISVSDLFKAPERVDPWEGVRDALTTGSVCTQYNIFQQRIEGDEDCLFLNVYSPQLPPTKTPRAVMVWIHGGGYIWGSGNTDLYGPDYLVDAGVVLVTINYRLGVLAKTQFSSLKILSQTQVIFLHCRGFYHSDESDVSANNGLRDQTMALRWVQDNIEQFGGDPDNVTIFGESAGGGSVHHLILSPLTKGLFHKAIPMSGSAFCPWAVIDGTVLKQRTLRLGQGLGFKDVNGVQSLADFLRTIPVNELVASQSKALNEVSTERKDFISLVGQVFGFKGNVILPQKLSNFIRTIYQVRLR